MIKETLDRSIAPEFVIPEKFNFQKVDSLVFSNGVKLYTLQAGFQPIVKLELSFVGGTSQDKGTFSSFFAAKLLDQGTESKTNEQIAEYVAYRGAHLEIISGNERIVFTLYTLKKHLEEMSHLLYEIINESNFQLENLERIKSIEYQNLEIKETKTSHTASTNFVNNLFPNHYYGKRLNTEEIEFINIHALKDFYQSYLVGANFEVYLSGAVDDDCIKIIDNIFGKDVLKKNAEISDTLSASNYGLHSIVKEGSVQASIRYGFQTIGKTHKDYALFSIVNEIFGGYFGSRLMTNIREDKGYTYGVGSYIVQLKNASYFQISTDVKAENAPDVLKEIQLEIDRMCQDKITNEELEKVRNYIFGSFATSLNTPFELMDKFKAVHLIGLDYQFYIDYFNVLKSISAQDIMDISQKYLANPAVISVCG